MQLRYLIWLITFIWLAVPPLFAQNDGDARTQPERWNIKSNLLYDVTGTLNFGTELSLSDRLSLDLSGNYNGWNWSGNRKWKHWMLQPEARLWLRQVFGGHFLALHALGGEYNFGRIHFPFGLFKELRHHRHEGWYAGGGIGYGHRWNLSPRWGLEAQAAIGYIHFNYRKYECVGCGERLGKDTRNFLGPTKVALNLVYRFGKRPARRPAPVVTPTVIVRSDTVEVVKRDTIIIKEMLPEPTIISRAEDLHLRYRQGNADILPSFASNAVELARAMNLIDEIRNDPTVEIKRIVITGYASPEGDEASNLRLSSERASALRDYLSLQLPRYAHIIVTMPGGEDWKGLEDCVTRDLSVPAQPRVLDAIASARMGYTSEAKSRLKELAGGEAYRYLLEVVYPGLRRVECRVEYTLKKEGGHHE